MSSYTCSICGRGRPSDALPTTEHSDDPPGFTLAEQPAVCTSCATTWAVSTREYRATLRQRIGVDDVGAVA